jgi:hypothetical protein
MEKDALLYKILLAVAMLRAGFFKRLNALMINQLMIIMVFLINKLQRK